MNNLFNFAEAKPLRSESWQQYLQCVKPKSNQDRWKYTPLSELRTIKLFALKPELDESSSACFPKLKDKEYGLVICDGFITEINLPAGCNLSKQESNISAKNNSASAIDKDESIEHIALAFAPHLYRIDIEGNDNDHVINVYIHFSTSKNSDCQLKSSSLSYNLLENAKIKIIEYVTAQNKNCVAIQHSQVDVARKASIEKVTLNSHNLLFHMICGGANISEDAFNHSITLYKSNNNNYRRHHCKVSLNGKRSVFKGGGVTISKDSGSVDWQWAINHGAPETVSHQLIRNVLDDKSKVSFFGLIHIDKQCPKSEGYQEARSILLSKTASSNIVPALKIYTDDVKCSHGAVVSPMDEIEEFYLTSRGLSAELVRQILLNGFTNVVIEEIKDKNLKGGGILYEKSKLWIDKTGDEIWQNYNRR